ncbi:hypothetical protein SUGI_1027150 [Cryptomeria japonica]|nr:hypothetical protein SUGI_1027150 [Cryptomeria japonica]
MSSDNTMMIIACWVSWRTRYFPFDSLSEYAEIYVLWLSRSILPLHRNEFDSDMEFTEMLWQDLFHDIDFSLFRYFGLEFDEEYFFKFLERRIQCGQESQIVIIRVVQRQRDGSFLRLTWNPGITCDSAAARNELAYDDFHELTPMVLRFEFFEGQFSEELTEFVQY